jgi:hypothetical protein
MMLAMSAGAWVCIAALVIIWVVLAFGPARVAGREGHSLVGHFILRLIFLSTLADSCVCRGRQGSDEDVRIQNGRGRSGGRR